MKIIRELFYFQLDSKSIVFREVGRDAWNACLMGNFIKYLITFGDNIPYQFYSFKRIFFSGSERKNISFR